MSLNLNFISSEFNLSVGSSAESKVYLFEGYGLDAQRKMLYRGECEVVLPLKAIETLIALIELRGEIVRKGDLMKIIWADAIVEASNLDHYLHVLRQALGQKSNGQSFIETLRRRGYRFTPDVQVIGAPNGNGTRVTAADSNPAQFTDRHESLTGSLGLAVESPSVNTLKRSRFSPLLGAIAVLAGLLRSAAIWYFQRQNLPNHAASLTARGEISVTPLGVAWSPDGKFIAYEAMHSSPRSTEGNCSIAAIEVSSLATKDLSPEQWDTCYRMAWTTDGEGLVFIGTRAGETYLNKQRDRNT